VKPNEYLNKILDYQTFDGEDQELKDLRARRQDIDKKLRSYFSKSSPSIMWAGSMAKGTMIRDSYDGDMTCYFPKGESEAGANLKEFYDNVEKALIEGYQVQRKASALRVRDPENWSTDLHIDVVPGRFTDETKSDVFLHRTTPDKERLKTNLQTHVDHIKGSGAEDAIRLMKLWKVRNGLGTVKTFVLELLVVKLLKAKKPSGLAVQLEYLWTELRDKADSLTVEDPANSNNDLRGLLDECRHLLSSAAGTTLRQIENNGWEAVYGEIDQGDGGERVGRGAALKVAVASVETPTRPYSFGR